MVEAFVIFGVFAAVGFACGKVERFVRVHKKQPNQNT